MLTTRHNTLPAVMSVPVNIAAVSPPRDNVNDNGETTDPPSLENLTEARGSLQGPMEHPETDELPATTPQVPEEITEPRASAGTSLRLRGNEAASLVGATLAAVVDSQESEDPLPPYAKSGALETEASESTPMTKLGSPRHLLPTGTHRTAQVAPAISSRTICLRSLRGGASVAPAAIAAASARDEDTAGAATAAATATAAAGWGSSEEGEGTEQQKGLPSPGSSAARAGGDTGVASVKKIVDLRDVKRTTGPLRPLSRTGGSFTSSSDCGSSQGGEGRPASTSGSVRVDLSAGKRMIEFQLRSNAAEERRQAARLKLEKERAGTFAFECFLLYHVAKSFLPEGWCSYLRALVSSAMSGRACTGSGAVRWLAKGRRDSATRRC